MWVGISGLGDDMAEYEKKLKVKIAGGTVQDMKIYSDEADIPPWQKPLRTKFEGTFEGWVPTSPLGSPDASALRVRHPDSDEIYVVNTIGRAAAGSTMVRTVGVVEFTVPAGVRKLRITCVGGGASGNAYRYAWSPGLGNAGQSTSFYGVIAGGGQPNGGEGPKHPTPQNGYYPEYGVTAGTTRSTNGNYAGGVGFGASSSGGAYCKSGNRGQIYTSLLDVLPNQVIAGYVGSGGPGVYYSMHVGGENSYNEEIWSGNGAQGCIYLEWGGSIE